MTARLHGSAVRCLRAAARVDSFEACYVVERRVSGDKDGRQGCERFLRAPLEPDAF
jgi:hypothetical protein